MMQNTIERKNCLLLNFTANSYHWGCFGTSIELYDSLIERGYYVTYRTVNDTHLQLHQTPTRLEDFDSPDHANRFAEANPSLVNMISDADVIVCNGEGTLHRNSVGPWNLLYQMFFAKKYFGKKVHLINHSCYPSGTMDPIEKEDLLYKGVLRNLDFIASREINSTAVLKQLGIDAVQSFDCLPRFIDRHDVSRTSSPDGPIVIAGGVSLNKQLCKEIIEGVSPFISDQRRALFITGAKGSPAGEDAHHFKIMRSFLPELELIEAGSMKEWLDVIGTGSVLVSGRYHHTIAAASLLTPVVCLPSNTLKIDGICIMMGIEGPIKNSQGSYTDVILNQVTNALDGKTKTISSDTWNDIVSLGERNFEGL